MSVSRYGLRATPPSGWNVQIRRDPRDVGMLHVADGGTVMVEDITHPVLHACTRPMRADRGDFGSGVTDTLGTEDVFMALVEYGHEIAGTGLYESQGFPRIAPSHFGPDKLQRPLPGLSAAQYFFTEHGRAFCLFVVLGSHARRMATVPRAALMSRAITVTPAAVLMQRGEMP